MPAPAAHTCSATVCLLRNTFGEMYLRLLLLLSFSIASSPRLVNVTIDDTYGDLRTGEKLSYAGIFQQAVSIGGFPEGISLAQVQNETLHAFINEGNFTLTFEGTAVYVFFVALTSQAFTVTASLDGKQRPAWYHPRNTTPSGGNTYMYNQPVFDSGSIDQSKHVLTVAIFANELQEIFFDYAIYTTDDSLLQDPAPGSPVVTHSERISRTLSASPKTASGSPDVSSTTAGPGHGSSTSNIPAAPAQRKASALIGGCVAGTIACIGASSVIILVWRRRRRRRSACEHQRTEKTDETVPQGEAGHSSEDAISLFVAQPTTADAVPPASGEKDVWQSALNKAGARAHHDAGARRVAEPPNLHPNATTADFEANETSCGREEDTFRAEDVQPRAMGTVADESAPDIRAELQRMRAEIEHLRQVARAAEPPPYSDGGRSEFGDRI